MLPTFKSPGDTFQINWYGAPGRGKWIHSVGAVAKVQFVAKSNPFTGIFQGAKNGFIRLSSAVEPAKDNTGLAPGMGLKFLRDGIDSANLVSMYSVNGNPKGNTNFFAEDFTNHIGAGTTTATEALSRKFATVTNYITSIGLSDFAKYGGDGQEVANPVFPFELRFAPNRAGVTNNTTKDFLTQLKGVPANSVVYDVYGYDKPPQMGGVEIHIGALQIDGKFTTSNFGDREFYVRH